MCYMPVATKCFNNNDSNKDMMQTWQNLELLNPSDGYLGVHCTVHFRECLKFSHNF